MQCQSGDFCCYREQGFELWVSFNKFQPTLGSPVSTWGSVQQYQSKKLSILLYVFLSLLYYAYTGTNMNQDLSLPCDEHLYTNLNQASAVQVSF